MTVKNVSCSLSLWRGRQSPPTQKPSLLCLSSVFSLQAGGGGLPGTQRWAHFPFPVLHLPAPPLCLNRKCGGRGGEGPSLSGRDLWEKR